MRMPPSKILLTLFVLSMITTQLAHAQSSSQVSAMLIWHQQSGQTSKVLLSRMIGQSWQAPVLVAQSTNPITTATLGKLGPNDIAAIWSEQVKGRLQLMIANADMQAVSWSKPQVLHSQDNWNMNPNLVYQKSIGAWLVWDSTRSDKAKVMLMVKPLEQPWSAAQVVNSGVDEPGFRSSAQINNQGHLEIKWLQLDRLKRAYVEVSKKVDIDTSITVPEVLNNDHIELSASEIALPGYIPQNAAVTIYFPNNKLIQSQRIDY